MKTEIFSENIDRASELIAEGKLVAVPTETVYGLAGNGLDASAVEEIYEVKGRPPVKALSLMVPGSAAMEKYCEDVPKQAKLLADKFWPGPLTIVLNSKSIVPEIVRAGGSTVALRCPDHPMTLKLLNKCGLPLAAPSANPSGEPSPKNADAVLRYFNGKISAVIDGGECILGTESTIIDMSATPYRILRKGALPADAIEAVLLSKLCIIGITGGSGCGKTTALNELKALGALIIDCDALYHEMLKEDEALLSDLRADFPEAFLSGEFDRKALGRLVFGDAEALIRLNTVTHGHIKRRTNELLINHALNGGSLAAIDAAALIESGVCDLCSLVVGVCADREARIKRIMLRDGIDRSYAELRIDAQKPYSFYEENCDAVLRNDGTEAEFTIQCRSYFKEVLKNV